MGKANLGIELLKAQFQNTFQEWPLINFFCKTAANFLLCVLVIEYTRPCCCAVLSIILILAKLGITILSFLFLCSLLMTHLVSDSFGGPFCRAGCLCGYTLNLGSCLSFCKR